MVGMIDPPRDEAKRAVQECNNAGIRVIVITGDYGLTAGAVAKEL
jgi:Ca2+-transporting ATPase